MKTIKLLSFIFLVLISVSEVYAQKLVFCEKVSHLGYPLNIKDNFNIKPQGTKVLAYLLSEKAFPYNTFTIEIYHNGRIVHQESVEIKSEANYCYKEHTYLKPGRYTVYYLTPEGKEFAYNSFTIVK